MTTRTQILNALIERHGYTSYLEIGVAHGDNLRAVKCASKVGVDPAPKGNVPGATVHRMSSDDYFTRDERHDIVFVDGLHTAEQSMIDALNALGCINEGGVVVLHDALPHDKWLTRPFSQFRNDGTAWTGSVWETVLRLAYAGSYDVRIVDTDWGVAVIRHKQIIDSPIELPEVLEWEKHRHLLDAYIVPADAVIDHAPVTEQPGKKKKPRTPKNTPSAT